VLLKIPCYLTHNFLLQLIHHVPLLWKHWGQILWEIWINNNQLIKTYLVYVRMPHFGEETNAGRRIRVILGKPHVRLQQITSHIIYDTELYWHEEIKNICDHAQLILDTDPPFIWNSYRSRCQTRGDNDIKSNSIPRHDFLQLQSTNKGCSKNIMAFDYTNRLRIFYKA
jgi:hypothetical protein